MDIYDALSKDHRHLESLLDQLIQASQAGSDQWKSLLDQVRMELIPHSHAEEAVFYNALREMDQSKDLVANSYREHAVAETEVRTLGAAKMVNANWTTLAEKLRKDLQHHIQNEEGRVFPAARQVFSDEEARQIGEAFLRLKSEMAKDADSIMGSTIDLVANLLPRRFSEGLRKALGSKKAA
jgi:hemerythrin superfamily protein